MLNPQTPPDLYHEAQVGVHCQILYLNALLGKKIVGADKVREAVNEQAKEDPNVAHTMGPQGFSDEAVTIYLDKAMKQEVCIGYVQHFKSSLAQARQTSSAGCHKLAIVSSLMSPNKSCTLDTNMQSALGIAK